MNRKNLVVVRAGDKSLHPQWLSEDRNWDLCVSYFGNYPERYKDQYDYLHLCKGSKWQGLNDYVVNNMDVINKYKYVWFPDDDLLTNCNNINNFFDITQMLNLCLSQPSLKRESYYSWRITLQTPENLARITDFVEIMAPCFEVETFSNFTETFSYSVSGWGLEFIWYKIASEILQRDIGIIDLTPILHTRPIGSAGSGGAIMNPHEEERILLEKLAIRKRKASVLKYKKIEV